MSGDISDISSAIGDMAQGSMAARAVEPNAGESTTDADGHTQESICLNCDTPLIGSHCHVCGQRAHVHRTIGAFFHDLVHGVLHFEGKFWRTLPGLAWRPGKVTREYIDGKRAKYISPIALFLFVVFVTFALFNVLGGSSDWQSDMNVNAASDMQTALDQVDLELANRQAELAALAPGDPARSLIEESVTDLTQQRETLSTIAGVAGTGDAADLLPELETSGAINEETVRSAWSKAKANPQLLIYKLQTNAYKFAWLLIPLSVPFVWLLFPFSRRFKMYDHTVFVTYSIAFMMGLAAAASLLIYMGANAAGALLLFYAPFHLYRHVRGTYLTSRAGAFWRMLVLSGFCWIAITLFGIGLAMAIGV